MPHRIAVNVVIVDNNASPRAVLRTVLGSSGYNVVAELTDAASLNAAMARLAPHIVCLESNLPDRDGVELLAEIRAAHPLAAVVMITDAEDPAARTAAIEAGAAGFLRVPFSPAQVLEEMQQVTHALQLLIADRSAPAQAPAPGKKRRRAVIADDSAYARALLGAILRDAGFDVVAEAADGRQAVDLAIRHRPDLTCLDMEMPVMGGLDALGNIHQAAPELKAIIVTNLADKDNVQAAVAKGARGYILKPLQPDKVIAAVRLAFLK